MLIDTQTCPFGAQIRREGEKLGGKVSCVINTHHHPEITGGNYAFTRDTRVLAHAKARPHFAGQMNRYISQVKEFLFREEEAGKEAGAAAVRKDWMALHKKAASFRAEEFAPTEVFDSAKKELEIGGRRLVLHFMSGTAGAHTDNDVVVHLPDDNVVIVGGLVSSGVHATIDRDGGASSVGWVAALEGVQKMCDAKTLVIPAAGKAGNTSVLTWQMEYLREVRSVVEKAVARGATRQEVRKLKPSLKVPAAAPQDPLSMALDAVYEEVKGEQDRSKKDGTEQGPGGKK